MAQSSYLGKIVSVHLKIACPDMMTYGSFNFSGYYTVGKMRIASRYYAGARKPFQQEMPGVRLLSSTW